MSREHPLNAMRPVDQGRAARLVAAAITADTEMFATAVQQTFADDFGFSGMGSTINVLRSLAEDLAGILVDVHGHDGAAELVRGLITQCVAAEEAGDV